MLNDLAEAIRRWEKKGAGAVRATAWTSASLERGRWPGIGDVGPCHYYHHQVMMFFLFCGRTVLNVRVLQSSHTPVWILRPCFWSRLLKNGN